MVNNNYPVDIPKTYTVSYFDEKEWNKDLTPQEIVQQQEIADFQNRLGEFEKAFGPCYRGCGGQNSKCNHYLPDYIPLNLACPACDNNNSYQWIHTSNGCNGHMYISKNVELKCMKCGIERPWKEWGFNCGNYAVHKGEHLKAKNNIEFSNALRFALALYAGDSGTNDVLRQIATNVINRG